MKRMITEEMLKGYGEYLYEEEKSRATIQKYMGDLRKLMEYLGGRELNKKLVIAYKEDLRNIRHYKTSSINSFLVAANRFFEYMGWKELQVKTYKIQRKTFISDRQNLTKCEYKRLVRTAEGRKNDRLSLILQTICTTGIRVGELRSITVESVRRGSAVIYNKGKERIILIPRKLQIKLMHYIKKHKLQQGCVFRTTGGKPVDRTYIWRSMKQLCKEAGVSEEKVYPHNLRHLFARTFVERYRDIVKLADILGHSNIETTRIYMKTTGVEHRRQLERLDLLVE